MIFLILYSCLQSFFVIDYSDAQLFCCMIFYFDDNCSSLLTFRCLDLFIYNCFHLNVLKWNSKSETCV